MGLKPAREPFRPRYATFGPFPGACFLPPRDRTPAQPRFGAACHTQAPPSKSAVRRALGGSRASGSHHDGPVSAFWSSTKVEPGLPRGPSSSVGTTVTDRRSSMPRLRRRVGRPTDGPCMPAGHHLRNAFELQVRTTLRLTRRWRATRGSGLERPRLPPNFRFKLLKVTS
jgi:hypothetical protein